MTTSHDRGSATIYKFPARGRFVAAGQHDEFTSAAKIVSPRAANVASGGAWYHDEAIKEADPVRNN